MIIAAAPNGGDGPVAKAAAQPFPIQHIVIIMQENRSFDSYFGTFPGADGIPVQDGVPTVCVPDLRPAVRENVDILGDLMQDFDFTQAPCQPLLLPVLPTTGQAAHGT